MIQLTGGHPIPAEIKQLPPGVVNKIAAGEVIERPASVLKELMENSIDAGARRIDVTVEKGGLQLIRVVDDGSGMSESQLPLAVASHATSKIRTADDLFSVGTMGFRGEALASIAEVSRFSLRSRTAESESGASLEVIGGRHEPAVPCGCPVGTTIEVEQLFFNTPVRRKFLKSTQTEMGHITEAFTRLGLAFPQVHFTLRHGQRTLYELPPVARWMDRIAALCGRELSQRLIPVESVDDEVRLTGLVGHPSENRGNNRMQYLFLNGRCIRDRSLQHALSEAYRGLILTGRYPVGFLRLTMPAELVDVNVHPTKLEVRFQDGGRLYSQLLSTLRNKFLTTDLTHSMTAPAASNEPLPVDPYNSTDARAAQARQELVDWVKQQVPSSLDDLEDEEADDTATPSGPEYQHAISFGEPDAPLQPLELTRFARPWKPHETPASEPPTSDVPVATTPTTKPPLKLSKALQVYDSYVIAQTEEGVVIIDQHALHERVLYEQIRERVLSGAFESQRLLIPETVDLTPAELAAVTEHRELLGKLGLTVEAFGENTVLVSSCPAMLRQCHPGELLREVLESLLTRARTPDRRDVLDELMHMMSCKAAIKAGDALEPGEISALLELRQLSENAHHCPHGRPTSLVLTKEDLEKQFKRT